MFYAFSREASKRILHESSSLDIGVGDLVEEAVGVEDNIEIVAASGHMHLIIPEKEGHQRKSIE